LAGHDRFRFLHGLPAGVTTAAAIHHTHANAVTAGDFVRDLDGRMFVAGHFPLFGGVDRNLDSVGDRYIDHLHDLAGHVLVLELFLVDGDHLLDRDHFGLVARCRLAAAAVAAIAVTVEQSGGLSGSGHDQRHAGDHQTHQKLLHDILPRVLSKYRCIGASG